jgi:hypothetical protein
MTVNCAHGKGIKFIREDLKFFAKTNIQANSGVVFKTIVLINADNLTIDAQSALRRCIELFSANTRFFIIVENKHKLLNPILSRFCEIYIPEYIVDGKVVNLHQYNLKKLLNFEDIEKKDYEWVNSQMQRLESMTYIDMVNLVTDFYEKGLSCLDLITWVKKTDMFECGKKGEILLHFDNVKSEYRCEKLLMLCIIDKFFRDD